MIIETRKPATIEMDTLGGERLSLGVAEARDLYEQLADIFGQIRTRPEQNIDEDRRTELLIEHLQGNGSRRGIPDVNNA